MSAATPQAAPPKLAVLMCVHRGSDPGHFAEALASMRAQTYLGMQLFIYCDGPLLSAHEEVMERLLRTGPGLDRIVRGAGPAGLPTGLNRLIDLALKDPTIEFMARMDADDISVPERLSRQVAHLRDRPDVSLAGSWCIEFSEPGVPLFYKQMPSDPREVRRFMLLRSPLVHPTVMFRRGVFERGHRYDPRLLIMQDYELWSRLLLAGEVISNVPEYLLWFRIGDGFFGRRHGIRRAWGEFCLRLRYSRHSRLFQPTLLLGLSALFLLRLMPAALKRLAYRHLR